MHHHTKFGADRSNRCNDMAIFRFFKMAAVRHLAFVIACFDHCAKFGLNRCSGSDNMLVLMFYTLRLKMLIHAHYGVFWGEGKN